MNASPRPTETAPPPQWRTSTTSALPALAAEVAHAHCAHTALLVLAVRDNADLRPGLAGICLVPFTRAQYRVDSAEEWAAVLDDARRVSRLSPAGPVLIEVAPELQGQLGAVHFR